MRGYYTGRLAGERLRRAYEIAPARVKQYLEAEIVHILDRVPRGGVVLELGCGYGRVAFRLDASSPRVVGVDTSFDSISLARALASKNESGSDCSPGIRPGWNPSPRGCRFVVMDAIALGFPDACFDAVVCVQNGICAFAVNPVEVLREALRVTRPGGRALFSSYADAFWPHRLDWFERQAAEGLVGSIDYALSRDGAIVCHDGFRAGTMRPDDFVRLCAAIDVDACITKVDGSSVFCEIQRGSGS